MLRLCRFLRSSSTGRTVGRVAGASPRLRQGPDVEESSKRPSDAIVLPWCARQTYDIHTEEWKYLDRMLAGVIGMSDKEVSERSLRLVGRDLLGEVEEPVVMLCRRRLQRQKMLRRAQARLMRSSDAESTTTNHHRGSWMAQKDLNASSVALERASEVHEKTKKESQDISTARQTISLNKERHASEAAAINVTKRALTTILTSLSERLPPGARIRTCRPKAANAEVFQEDNKKSPSPHNTLLRGNMRNVQGVVNHIGFSAAESAINNGKDHTSRINSISKNETDACLDVEVNKSQLRKQLPHHCGIGARKKISSRKVKDKSVISVHLV